MFGSSPATTTLTVAGSVTVHSGLTQASIEKGAAGLRALWNPIWTKPPLKKTQVFGVPPLGATSPGTIPALPSVTGAV